VDRRQGHPSLRILRYRFMGWRRRLLEVWVYFLGDSGSIPNPLPEVSSLLPFCPANTLGNVHRHQLRHCPLRRH